MLSRLMALAFICSASSTVLAADYCLAIRGNGELEPAHWGAISNVVERLGMPKMQAGGSSASITMFLLDAVATNVSVKGATLEDQRAKGSLLVKSFEGFMNYLMTTSQFRDFKIMYAQATQFKDTASVEQILAILEGALSRNQGDASAYVRENAELIRRNFNTAVQVGLVSQDSIDRLQGALNEMLSAPNPGATYQEIRKSRFYISELLASIRRLGSYDTDHDSNLFFRPSVIDFDQFATQVGRIGDFYANADWTQFFAQCSAPAEGHLWTDLVQAHPECGTQLNALIAAHFAAEHDGFSSRTVGVSIPSFPTTAVLTGAAATDVSDAFQRYNKELNSTFGDSFKVSDPELVRFGYWGNEDALMLIQKSLPAADEKSRRFFALGSAPWHEVLSLSPAEPGLSPLKFFSHGDKSFVSAGGWSDLHPVLILKAAGCENVVYVTRRGPESTFAQGVARRLLNFEEPIGDPADMNSMWSRLFNVYNPESSYKRSLASADAVLCTQWDSFSLKKGMSEMIADAYASPFYVPLTSGLVSQRLSPRLDPGPAYMGCY